MRTLAVAAALACLVAGQTAEKTLRFTHGSSPQEMQEIAAAIRAIAGISHLTVGAETGTMSLVATDEQAVLADWLLAELDRAPAAERATRQIKTGSGEVVRIFFTPDVSTVPDFQEVAAVLRSTIEIRNLVACNKPRALVMRGTTVEGDAAEWLVNALRGGSSGEFRIPNMRDGGVLRVFRIAGAGTEQDLHERVTMLRGIGEIRRVMTCTAPRTVAVNGTEQQIELAAWLLRSLSVETAAEFRMDGHAENTVRLFRLPERTTMESAQETAKAVRDGARLRRVFVCSRPPALAVRGPAENVKTAETLIAKLTAPHTP